MPLRKLKPGFFLLEGLNSFAVVYYFFYLYFFMQARHGFDNQANLELAALNGAVCVVASWFGGKFAQGFGYFTALKLGWSLMLGAMLLGLALESAPGHILAAAVAAGGMCFTWPTLEALASEGETRAGLPHMVGIYNLVWAASAAVSNFTGGALLTKLGLKSLFYVPAAIQVTQLGLTFWLEARAAPAAARLPGGAEPIQRAAGAGALAASAAEAIAPSTARKFLRMAWLANPFAYIAITTLVAVIPGLAQQLKLSTMLAGFCCSVWCFARFGAFFALWLWDGWHYRFRWLLLAYLALITAFAAILLVPSLPVLVLAQVMFGAAVGLIYYSSLFYSMDVGDTKVEHGGLHEAAIALGNFTGPAVGAAALHFLPQYANSGALAVSALLGLGLAGLTAIRAGDRRTFKA
ncbi:MAG: MFS transporter [Verrucomicrobiota bacterium]|jgi:predicted MFS family arabinose efflux permease